MKNVVEPDWSSEDAIALRHFIESKHGQKFLVRLAWLRPDFTTTEATQRLIESGKIEGFELAESAIGQMLEDSKPIKEEAPSFPSLDDESGVWNEVDIAAQNATTT